MILFCYASELGLPEDLSAIEVIGIILYYYYIISHVIHTSDGILYVYDIWKVPETYLRESPESGESPHPTPSFHHCWMLKVTYVLMELGIQSVRRLKTRFTSPLRDLFIPTPTRLSGKHSATIHLMREDNLLPHFNQSVARYSPSVKPAYKHFHANFVYTILSRIAYTCVTPSVVQQVGVRRSNGRQTRKSCWYFMILDIANLTTEFVLYAADNVDHNITIALWMNMIPFMAMLMIAAVTPGTRSNRPIPGVHWRHSKQLSE